MDASKHVTDQERARGFASMPLLRAYYSFDMEAGTMVRHEVRRDPTTGLTLTRATPVDRSTDGQEPNANP